MIPAAALMTASVETAGVPLVIATALVNFAYAIGELVGAPVAANTAQLVGDLAPCLGLAGLMVLTGLLAGLAIGGLPRARQRLSTATQVGGLAGVTALVLIVVAVRTATW